jgi:hypothetical protein
MALFRKEKGPIVSNAICISHHVLYSETTQERLNMHHTAAAAVSHTLGYNLQVEIKVN